MVDTYLPPEFKTAIALGLVPDHVRAFAIGFNPSIDIASVPEEGWGGNGLYPWMTAATNLEILSSSANDSAAGTGARTVRIDCLTDRYVQVTLMATLNGVTPVQLGTPVFRINGIRCIGKGSVGTNVGDLTIRDTGGGATRGIVLAGVGLARQSNFTVPAGKFLAIPELLLAVESGTGTVDRSATMTTWFSTSTTCEIQPLRIRNTNGEPYNHMSNPPIMVQERTDFNLRIVAVSDNATAVTTGWNGFLKTL